VFRYPGECKLIFKVDVPEGEEVLVSAHGRFDVIPCNEFLAEVDGLLGHRAWELF